MVVAGTEDSVESKANLQHEFPAWRCALRHCADFIVTTPDIGAC